MIYFTSDLHINHDQPFIYEARGFNNIIDHDTALLKNWNDIIQPEDTVYILGDLCLGNNESEWNRIFYNLKGKKYFIRGNHDTDRRVIMFERDYHIYNCGYANILKHSKKYHFYLSHYPTYTANYDDDKKYPLINLAGHCHTKNKFSDMNKGFIYHVELDAHNMYPVSIEQIIKDIKEFNL